MSVRPAIDPECTNSSAARVVETVIDARARDLGGVQIRRVLPSRARRMVGPFTFFDQMGAAVFGADQGFDVRPHPHIGLATVTYLFEGEILHRDSLGSVQSIRPGDINWMTAGRGITHSERTPPERRRDGSRLHGLQLWVALPIEHEEVEPSFSHHPGSTLPTRAEDGVELRVLAGSAYGVRSPVEILSPLFYVDAILEPESELALPIEHAERAVYVVQGAVGCGAEQAEAGRMLVFAPRANVVLRAKRASRIVLLGGAPLEGRRIIDWNFVSSSNERIAQARRDWKEDRFPKVPGDDVEFIPLPE